MRVFRIINKFPAALYIVSVTLFTLFSNQLAYGGWDFGAKYAGEFMTLGAGARSAAMGETGTAYAGGASSAYWNPAALTDVREGAAALMHADRFGGVVKYDFLAAAQRFSDREVFAVTVFRLAVDDVPITTLQDPASPISPENIVLVDKWTSDSETAVMGTYAFLWKENWTLGVTGKILNKKVGDNIAFGLGFDVGTRYSFADDFHAGLRISDVTTTFIGWDTGHNEVLLPSMSVGVAKSFALPKMEADLVIAVDAGFRAENRGDADQFAFGAFSGGTHAGVEYIIKKTLSLRGGMDEERFTAGAGLKVGPAAVDYAYQSHEGLGESHRVSLGFRWPGNPLKKD